MKKFVISMFLCLILSFSALATPIVQAYTPPPDVVVHAKSVYMVNLETETVVYEKDPTDIIYPASLTKLMTALVAMDLTPDLNKKVIVYPDVVEDLWGTGAATAFLYPEEEVTMEHLLNLLLIPSACDAANVIAMATCGSKEAFVNLMNQKAAELGMTNTHYVNAHGLHDPAQTTTAYDLYLLAKEVVKSPLLTKICGTTSYTLPPTNISGERVYNTTNLMMLSSTDWYYQRIQGLKTGFTDEAGRNLVSLAEKDGQRYITVVMGCPPEDADGYSQHYEFDDTYKLLYWAYTDLTYKNVINTTQPVEEISVTLCKETDFVKLVPEKEFYAIVPQKSADNVILSPKLNVQTLEAPVEKGTVLGTADVMCAGEKVGTINLVAQETCERNQGMYVMDRIKKGVLAVVTSPWFWIPLLILVAAVTLFVVWNVRDNRRRRRLYNSKVRKQDQ